MPQLLSHLAWTKYAGETHTRVVTETEVWNRSILLRAHTLLEYHDHSLDQWIGGKSSETAWNRVGVVKVKLQ